MSTGSAAAAPAPAGLTREQKEAQVAGGNAAPAGPGPDALEIISPEPIIYRLSRPVAGQAPEVREYAVLPLPIRKQRLLQRLQTLSTDTPEESYTELVRIVGALLNEPDLEWVEDCLTTPGITELAMVLREAENRALAGLIQQAKKKQVKPAASGG
jgi:hypothetical protein